MDIPAFADVTIERILPGGIGLAHAEGLTVFVSLAAPGDVLRVRIDRSRGNVLFASIVEILQPSPLRVEPPCPYFGVCGGCDFQQLKYESQLDAKVEIIRDCLRRIAKISDSTEIKIQAAPTEWHYRVRANWQIDPATRHFGYFEAGSHRVCDVEFCAVLTPALESTLESLRRQLRAEEISYLPKDVRAVVGQEGVSVGPAVGGFTTSEVSQTIAGETYWFNADSFFQINEGLLESLVKEALGDASGAMAVDLYCGVGLFTLPLARRFDSVSAIEVNHRATAFAKKNLENAGLTNAEVITSDVGHWLNEHTHWKNKDQLDFLLLDPPRTGAENVVIKGILNFQPQHISYVSCDPATLARDLKKLMANGYAIQSIKAFDMFPQTHHVETVVHLRQA